MAKGWVRKAAIYENIKDVYSNRSRGFPFSEFRIEGKYAFKNTGDAFQLFVRDENGNDIDDKEYLKLEDKDTPFGKPSGAVKLVVAKDWRVKLWIGTDNNNYWDDNSELENLVQRDGLDRQDVIIVTLDGNDDDYLSIDIDQQFSGINNFRLRSGGVMRNDSQTKDINDEVRIAILSAEHYEELQDEVQGPLEEGGEGDIDNDGVKDKDDADPYDPDIQEEGDVDDDPVLTDDDDFVPPPPPPPPTPPTPPTDDKEVDMFRALMMGIVLVAIGYLAWNMVRRVPLPGGEDPVE